MLRSSLSAVLLLLVSACWGGDTHVNFESAPVSTMGGGSYQYGATIDGEITWWTVPFEKVEQTPDWVPDEEPPLSFTEAVRIAQREVPKYTETPGAYRLDKVEWLNVTNCCPSKKWIYLVSFERDWEYQGEKFSSRGTITIPVLLDGTVIEGTKKKQPAT